MAQRPSLPKMNPGGFAEARASQASTIRWPCFSRILEPTSWRFPGRVSHQTRAVRVIAAVKRPIARPFQMPTAPALQMKAPK